MEGIRNIEYGGRILAIVVNTYSLKDNLTFFSPEDFPIQAGLHNKKKGHLIAAHEHVPFEQVSIPTQELFYIKKGCVKIGLFYEGKRLEDVIMNDGDLIILNTGHDLTFLEDTTLLEVKQGPYRGKDKEKRMI